MSLAEGGPTHPSPSTFASLPPILSLHLPSPRPHSPSVHPSSSHPLDPSPAALHRGCLLVGALFLVMQAVQPWEPKEGFCDHSPIGGATEGECVCGVGCCRPVLCCVLPFCTRGAPQPSLAAASLVSMSWGVRWPNVGRGCLSLSVLYLWYAVVDRLVLLLVVASCPVACFRCRGLLLHGGYGSHSGVCVGWVWARCSVAVVCLLTVL